MAWIESHQELARHPKTRKLARLLGVSVPCAIGHLHLLWWWAVDYADNGWLGKYTADDVADAVLWEGDAQTLWDALCESGYLDRGAEGAEIHDWGEYAGRLLEQRRKDAERKRLSRASPQSVQSPSAGRPPDIHSPSGVTVPNSTVPNSTDSTGVPPLSPPQRGKPTKTAFSDQDRRDMVEKWVAAYGGEDRVGDEIDAALNHTSSLKCKSQRLYVDRWLRRGIEDFKPKGHARTNGAVPASSADAVCLCAELLERLTRYPKAHAYCEVHGDVRETSQALPSANGARAGPAPPGQHDDDHPSTAPAAGGADESE